MHPLPHVLDSCVPGFVQSILLHALPSSHVPLGSVERILRLRNSNCAIIYSSEATFDHLQIILNKLSACNGNVEEENSQLLLHSKKMQELRISSIPSPFISRSGTIGNNICSIYLTLPLLSISQHSLTSWISKVVDSNGQSDIILVLGKLFVEGYSRDLQVFRGHPQRTILSAPRFEQQIRLDQQFFVVGWNLDKLQLSQQLRQLLTSQESLMKTILNIDGKGEFALKMKRPLITRESLIKEDFDHIATVVREAPLPDGIYHDGVNYVDWEGRRSKIRPDFDFLVDKWLEQQNMQIQKENNRIVERKNE